MSNNWQTPKSEKLLALEALMEERDKEIRALHPHLSDAEAVKMLEATPWIVALYDEVADELKRRRAEEILDKYCFVYGTDGKGNKMVIDDGDLRRMTDEQLAAWAQKTGVMVAQLKAHLAERFPETKFKVVP
jgi:hypothetical protein